MQIIQFVFQYFMQNKFHAKHDDILAAAGDFILNFMISVYIKIYIPPSCIFVIHHCDPPLLSQNRQ